MKKLHVLLAIGLAVLLSIVLHPTTGGRDNWTEADALTELTASSEDMPLSVSPLLSWEKNLDAVAYEIEFFIQKPSFLSSNESADNADFRSRRIYANFFNPPLREFASEHLGKTPFYWRVRPLGLDGEPLAPFSRLAVLYTDPALPPMDSPYPLPAPAGSSPLLYPVYHWVRQYNAASFIVQLFTENPENNPAAVPMDTLSSKHCELYDEKPRYALSDMYWRVHALDEQGKMLGQWSSAVSFRTSPADNWQVAVLGDSISHGGGHVSYGPVDMEYSWLSYLDFPAINLSCSGDTTKNMLSRFERDVVPFHPSYLLVFDGSNSLRNGSPASEVIEDFRALKRLCLAYGIKPIFLTLPPINPGNIAHVFHETTAADWRKQFEEVNDYLRTEPHIDIAAAFDEADAAKELPTKYALDGLHEDIPGKKLIAKTVNAEWEKARNEADKLLPPGAR